MKLRRFEQSKCTTKDEANYEKSSDMSVLHVSPNLIAQLVRYLINNHIRKIYFALFTTWNDVSVTIEMRSSVHDAHF